MAIDSGPTAGTRPAQDTDRPGSHGPGAARGSGGVARLRRAVRTPLGGLVAFAVAYLALSEIGLRLTFPPSGIAAYWPGAGLAIGCALRWPRRRRPALLAVLAAANLVDSVLHGRPVLLAAGFAACNVTETFVAAALARATGSTHVRTARGYLGLAFAVATGAAVGGAGAALTTAASGGAAWLSSGVVWAGSDGLGALLLAPVLLDAGHDRGAALRHRTARWASGAAAVLVVAAMFTVVRAPLAYVALAAVVTLAAALPRRLFAVSLAVAATTAVVLTAHGRGPFVVPRWSTNERVLAVVGFLIVCAVLGTLLSCLLSARADAEASSERARAQLRAVLDRSPVGIVHVDSGGGILLANPQWSALTGTDQPLPPSRLTTVVPDDAAHVAAAATRMLAGDRVDDCEFRVHTPAGERWLAAAGAPVPRPAGGYVVTVTDVTERRWAQEMTWVERVVRHAPIGMCLVEVPAEGPQDATAQIVVRRTNPALETLLGTRDPDAVAACLRPVLPAAGDHADVELQRADGRAVWVRASTATLEGDDAAGRLLVVQLEDVSDRKAAERDLVHRALHDPLTGLPNRQLLADRLDQSLARSRRDGTTVAALYIDLDHFKSVNDRFGHEAGDRLLVHVGHRLGAAVRGSDTAARLGGDEFVVLAQVPTHPGGDPATEAEGIAQRVRSELARPFDLDGRPVSVSASIGLVLAAPDDDPTALLRDSDAAMYDAKERGRNRYRVYDAAMRSKVVDLRAVEESTRRALETGRLALHYQPLVDVGGAVRGVEALLRITDPVRGVQLPGRAIRAAEESRLIADLGRWVLRRIMLDAPEVTRRLGDVRFYYNLSARQPGYDDVPALVRTTATETGFGLDRLVVEITESAMLETDRSFVSGLAGLRADGVGVAVDDFGTGYSSLTYLRTLPLDILKIDGSFVAGAQDTSPDRDIVSAVVGLARGLGLTVVAEGVESQAQADTVVALGTDLLQGFHVGRPVPLDELCGPAGGAVTRPGRVSGPA